MTLCNTCRKADTTCPIYPTHTLTCVAYLMTDLAMNHLKTRIADRAAIADIETYCRRRHDGQGWLYDTTDCDPETRDWITEAVDYLNARGLLERHANEVRITADLSEVA